MKDGARLAPPSRASSPVTPKDFAAGGRINRQSTIDDPQ
jgi:hypothetical protein